MKIGKKVLYCALTLMLALSMLITPAFATEGHDAEGTNTPAAEEITTESGGSQDVQEPGEGSGTEAGESGEAGQTTPTDDPGNTDDPAIGGDNTDPDTPEEPAAEEEPAAADEWIPSVEEPDNADVEVKEAVVCRRGGRDGEIGIFDKDAENIADVELSEEDLEAIKNGELEIWNGYAYKKAEQTVTAIRNNYTVPFGTGAFSLGAKASGGGELSFSSDNEAAVSVNESGVVFAKDITPAPATITVTAAESKYYKASDAAEIKVSVSAPAAPYLAVVRGGKRKIRMEWSVVPGAVRYEVYCPQFKASQRSGATTGTSITSKKLKKGKRYYCTVRAIVAVGNKTYATPWTAYVRSPKVK